jgi:TM2 domain-containing membrane protein YozV
MKDKNVAGILALFLGGFGVHRFYLGQGGLGFFYLIFCWFPLMWVIGIIDAIVFFTTDKDTFDAKYNKAFIEIRRRQQPNFQGERYYYDRNMQRHERREERSEYREYRREERTGVSQRVDNSELKNSGIRKFRDFDYDGAIADFQKALKLDPRDIAVHFNLACAYSLNEKPEEAFYHLDKAVEMGFNDYKRIKQHDALAYLRIQPEFDDFEQNGFRLQQQPTETVELVEKAKISAETETGLELQSEDLLGQLKRLGDLREKGLLTEEEFAAQKKKLLGS